MPLPWVYPDRAVVIDHRHPIGLLLPGVQSAREARACNAQQPQTDCCCIIITKSTAACRRARSGTPFRRIPISTVR